MRVTNKFVIRRFSLADRFLNKVCLGIKFILTDRFFDIWIIRPYMWGGNLPLYINWSVHWNDQALRVGKVQFLPRLFFKFSNHIFLYFSNLFCYQFLMVVFYISVGCYCSREGSTNDTFSQIRCTHWANRKFYSDFHCIINLYFLEWFYYLPLNFFFV